MPYLKKTIYLTIYSLINDAICFTCLFVKGILNTFSILSEVKNICYCLDKIFIVFFNNFLMLINSVTIYVTNNFPLIIKIKFIRSMKVLLARAFGSLWLVKLVLSFNIRGKLSIIRCDKNLFQVLYCNLKMIKKIEIFIFSCELLP